MRVFAERALDRLPLALEKGHSQVGGFTVLAETLVAIKIGKPELFDARKDCFQIRSQRWIDVSDQDAEKIAA